MQHYPGNVLTPATMGNIGCQQAYGACRRAGKLRPLINLLQMNDAFATISHRCLGSQLVLYLLHRVQESALKSEKLPLEMCSLFLSGICLHLL